MGTSIYAAQTPAYSPGIQTQMSWPSKSGQHHTAGSGGSANKRISEFLAAGSFQLCASNESAIQL